MNFLELGFEDTAAEEYLGKEQKNRSWKMDSLYKATSYELLVLG